ncbi:MAG: glycosyltransferase family 2 protein [Patescibacteria group bacterium]|nr:glycosyltransferase family 2 protein [Patescibacteria group bacterium]
MVFFSWLIPAGAAIFIILFDIYWFLKTIYFSLHLRITFKTLRKNLEINWLKKLRISSFKFHDIHHLIIFPMYNEPYTLVKETFSALANSNYPKDKFIVALAIEERAFQQNSEQADSVVETAKKIEREFSDKFFKLIVTIHPKNLPDEIPGKGSNETWSAKEVKRLIIDPLNIPYENILVSVFDVDTQVLPEYFGVLTYNFLTAEHPQRSSYQPVPLFINNIFETPALARVISFSSTFWHMIQQARPHRLTTFSSHSMPFKALVEIGFWNTDVVSEDSRIFWQCYIHYNGDWRVVPINYPVPMDANVAPTFWQTMINQYKQQRRWGWGCENIPYLLEGFRKNRKIPFAKKWYWSFNYIEGFHSWATNTLIIFSLGWLSIILGGANFRFTLLSYSLPKITGYIMNFAMIGMVSSAILSIIFLPPKPEWFKKRHYILYFIQWILMPVTLIIFGAFPALEAQTRLALGGKFRLGFWVTPKHR